MKLRIPIVPYYKSNPLVKGKSVQGFNSFKITDNIGIHKNI